MGFFDVWKDAFLSPVPTFRKMKKKADLVEGFKHVLVAGIIAGILGAIVAAVAGAAVAEMGPLGGLFAGAAIAGVLIGTPILAVLGWLIGSLVWFVFARLLGGKGSYTAQTYLIALYTAPLIVITAVLNIIPLVGAILGMLVSLYGLYLLTMAIREAHGFDTVKAALSWIIPLVIVGIIVFLAGVAFLGAMLGGAGGGLVPTA